jgi:hypothetical protein
MSSREWSRNAAAVAQQVAALAGSTRTAALLSIDLDRTALDELHDADRARTGELLHRAWQRIVDVLPANTVGHRAGWATFEFVVEAAPEDAGRLGRSMLAALRGDDALAAWRWRIIFTEIFRAEPDRTLMCDPGYDIPATGNVIAWVKPYPGDDWRESQRYPTVTLLEL